MTWPVPICSEASALKAIRIGKSANLYCNLSDLITRQSNHRQQRDLHPSHNLRRLKARNRDWTGYFIPTANSTERGTFCLVQQRKSGARSRAFPCGNGPGLIEFDP